MGHDQGIQFTVQKHFPDILLFRNEVDFNAVLRLKIDGFFSAGMPVDFTPGDIVFRLAFISEKIGAKIGVKRAEVL
jgi:hypothetical protein